MSDQDCSSSSPSYLSSSSSSGDSVTDCSVKSEAETDTERPDCDEKQSGPDGGEIKPEPVCPEKEPSPDCPEKKPEPDYPKKKSEPECDAKKIESDCLGEKSGYEGLKRTAWDCFMPSETKMNTKTQTSDDRKKDACETEKFESIGRVQNQNIITNDAYIQTEAKTC